MSTYIKEYLNIVEIENKKCQICSRLKTTAEVVSDKLIMFLEGLPTSNKDVLQPKTGCSLSFSGIYRNLFLDRRNRTNLR